MQRRLAHSSPRFTATHSRERGNPDLQRHLGKNWVPVFAEMSGEV
jgi:hypothetical protein